MSRSQPGLGELHVKRTFAPTRLSATLLAEAYERIVPPRICVLRSQVRPSDERDQHEQPPARRRAA